MRETVSCPWNEFLIACSCKRSHYTIEICEWNGEGGWVMRLGSGQTGHPKSNSEKVHQDRSVVKGPSLGTWSRQTGNFWVSSTTPCHNWVLCRLPFIRIAGKLDTSQKTVRKFLQKWRIYWLVDVCSIPEREKFQYVRHRVQTGFEARQVLYQKLGGSHTLCIERMGCVPGHSPVLWRLIQHRDKLTFVF